MDGEFLSRYESIVSRSGRTGFCSDVPVVDPPIVPVEVPLEFLHPFLLRHPWSS